MIENSNLHNLFQQYGTDKTEYARAYEVFFLQRRNQVTTLLEIGIGTLDPDAHSSMLGWAASHYRPGGSLRAWRDYLPKAKVIGVDVQPDTQFSEDRIQTYLCDSTDSNSVGKLIEEANLSLVDVIIDDGSHRAEDQLITAQNFLPLLAADGLYVIEDVAGNGLFQRRDELLSVFGDATVFFVGQMLNPIFIQKY